jgi:sec-independent protein translocase protein TatC
VAAEPVEGARMTVVEHLTELRRRLIISLVAVALGGIVAFLLYNRILHVLIGPYCDTVHGRTCRLFVTSPLEPFAVRLKIAAYGGIALATPVLFWQIWRFVTPGLHDKEKRYAIPFLISSVLLFALGGLIAWITLPKALSFLVSIGGNNLETIFSPEKYISLIALMILAFGISFEFPILLVFLELVGVVTSRRLGSWRRQAIVTVVAFAAVITPSQDPFSLFAMAIPMYIFYEVSILIGKLLKK